MKRTNKIIAAMLAGSMILPCIPVGAENSPSSNNVKIVSKHASKWEEYFETLKEYGIFVGYDDGESKPYNIITRAEMTKALCAALGLNPEGAGNQRFSDVDSSHWAYKYINALANMGIVLGTGNNLFEPERAITINEGVKMLVCALGYAPRADVSGGYPDGYIRTAKTIGLNNDLELVSTTVPCERHVAFMLFCNALDVPFMTKRDNDGEEEYIVADGKDGRDYITMRYKITGKRNEG